MKYYHCNFLYVSGVKGLRVFMMAKGVYFQSAIQIILILSTYNSTLTILLFAAEDTAMRGTFQLEVALG